MTQWSATLIIWQFYRVSATKPPMAFALAWSKNVMIYRVKGCWQLCLTIFFRAAHSCDPISSKSDILSIHDRYLWRLLAIGWTAWWTACGESEAVTLPVFHQIQDMAQRFQDCWHIAQVSKTGSINDSYDFGEELKKKKKKKVNHTEPGWMRWLSWPETVGCIGNEKLKVHLGIHTFSSTF